MPRPAGLVVIWDWFLYFLFACVLCWYAFTEVRRMRDDAGLRAALGLRRTVASWLFSWTGYYQWTGEAAGARLTLDRFYGPWTVGWIWRTSVTLPPRHPAAARLYAWKHGARWSQLERPLSSVFGGLRRQASPVKWGDRWSVCVGPEPRSAALLEAAGELDPNEWDIIALENGSLRCEKLSQPDPASPQDFLDAIAAARRLDASLGAISSRPA